MPERSAANARLSKLGRYEVLNELGKGAMGVVYLAKDPVIGRMVAIKTIRLGTISDDDSEAREFRERFIREAQTAGILSHTNIVTIHDIGEDAGTKTSFIAMEYIEGKNLKTLLLEKAQFSYDQIADIIAQVAEALDYAHRKGIIHRDVKPANIIITTDGKVKITDFGIAKIASSNLTTTGQFLGTPNYMSPEQVSGAPVDGRSDIFSLGVVLYELLTSRKPFLGENLTAISYKIVHEDFTPPAELSADVPAEFNPIVARAMAKDPWNRYQRGKDFALALHQLRAHLEEQRALQDLGTLVSAAENLPTMKLANLDQLLREAAPEAGGSNPSSGSSEVLPPSARETAAHPTEVLSVPVRESSVRATESDTSPSSRRAGRGTISVPVEKPAVAEDSPLLAGEASLAPSPPGILAPALSFGQDGRQVSSFEEEAAPAPRLAVPADLNRISAQDPAAGSAASFADYPATRTVPLQTPAPVVEVPGPPAGLAWDLRERAKEWMRLSRREINPRWFWIVSLSAGGLFLLLVSILAVRALSWKPTVKPDAILEAQTRERKESLDQGKKLLSAGRYKESLALFRKVLAGSPGNTEARLYAQMAENALEGRAEETRRQAEAENTMRLAQEAFAAGNFAEAKRFADEVLQLDGGKIDAQQLREAASTELAKAESETVAAERKKAAKPRGEIARKEPSVPASRVGPLPAKASEGPANAPAGPATLRLLFDSPLSEGHIMIAVNNVILLRKPFSFKKKSGLFKTIEETGTVSATIPVNPGAASVKAWLSGPDIRGGVMAEQSARLSPGETRTLRLNYAGGNLSMRIQ